MTESSKTTVPTSSEEEMAMDASTQPLKESSKADDTEDEDFADVELQGKKQSE